METGMQVTRSRTDIIMSEKERHSKPWKKRLFVSLTVVLFCLCYVGLFMILHDVLSMPSHDNLRLASKYSDIAPIFTNTPQLETQGFDGHWLSYTQRESALSFRKQKWRQTSLYEIFEKHKSRTSQSCVNICDAKRDMGCSATSAEAWDRIVVSPDFTFMSLLSDFEFIYPFEVEYLSYPPMTDNGQLPSLTQSKVYLEGTRDGEVYCAVGDTLQGRVDLVDGRGKQRTMGGDAVRAWMVSKQVKEYRAAGHVVDMRNGSYQISVRCLWPGKSKLNVAVVYPREFLRVVIQQIHLGVTWLFVARFKKGQIEEVTLCTATPNIPGRPCICNFTSVNKQSLYCGRPLDSRLTCADWVHSACGRVPIPHHVTPAERHLIVQIPKPASFSVIHHNITIVGSNKGKLPKLKPCSGTNTATTWRTEHQPSGYWSPGKKWQSLICERPEMTPEWTVSCLQNSNVWIFGDSNGIRSLDVISNKSSIERSSGSWPFRVIRRDRLHAITLTFTPSEYPFYQDSAFQKRLLYGGVAQQIDRIPSNGTHFLVIHYYLHIAPVHLSAVYLRWKAAHDAIQRLINRNPNVVVGILGPHVSSVVLSNNHAVGGDNLGVFWLEMIQHIFADLRHKVVFLDGWEMTVALDNPTYHPDKCVPEQLMRTLLAFRCP